MFVLPFAGFLVGALFFSSCDIAGVTPITPPKQVTAADDCYHVYVDLGTNIGVQIHKLYNPGYFPTAPG